MSNHDPQDVDDEIRTAFAALDAALPRDRGDDFQDRLDNRLAAIDREAAEQTGDAGPSSTAPPHTPRPGDAVGESAQIEQVLSREKNALATVSGPFGHRDEGEQSDLHDIRALAKSAKMRISQERTAQTSAEELLWAPPSATLPAVALPKPNPSSVRTSSDHAERNREDPAGAEEDGAGLPAWLYAAVAAVAAVAVLLFVVRGGASGTQRSVKLDAMISDPTPSPPPMPNGHFDHGSGDLPKVSADMDNTSNLDPTREKWREAMAGLDGPIRECYEKHGQLGKVETRVRVAPSGQVISVDVVGQFRATPTGKCVAKAVESAKMPAFDGPTQTVEHDFILAR
ncbi:MAG: hypothetical protein MJE77_28570 [Proteobacteria bacterium]|nr:hypothetical protein [Pseudomonadota bacterium]